MSITLSRIFVPILLFLFSFLLLPHHAFADQHALLIGIGSYGARPLEGPPHDAMSMQEVLLSRYGFKYENVVTLIEKDATRARILEELERLVNRTRTGDKVLVFFSGHGTSSHDIKGMSLPLPHDTGALVPADFRQRSGDSLDAIMSMLIIGKRDLRPILSKLDQGRQVMVIVDACFSENTTRSIIPRRSGLVSKHMPLNFRQEVGGGWDPDAGKSEPYPYRNIFTLSAASKSEQAEDISSIGLRSYPTVDGKPHGAMPDALLRVLDGDVFADTDHDGQLSLAEIQRAVTDTVSKRFRQTGQGLPKEGEAASRLKNLAFFRSPLSEDKPASPSGPLRIKVDASVSQLRKHVSEIKGVKVEEGNSDLILLRDMGEVVLALPNGHHLCRFKKPDPELIAGRIRRHQLLRPLMELAYPRQGFNVSLELTGNYQKGIVKDKEILGFQVRAEKNAHIFLIDIDPEGLVHVIYPRSESEMRAVSPESSLELKNECQVTPPFGTETLKVFAFEGKPQELAGLASKDGIVPGSPVYEKIERMVGIRGEGATRASVRTDAAQCTMQVTSYGERDFR